LILDFPRGRFVVPAGVVGGDVDQGVLFVPGGEGGVFVGLDGTKCTGDEGDDAGDFGFAVYFGVSLIQLRLGDLLLKASNCFTPKHASPTPIRTIF